jgi:hypothetical protein
MYFSKIIYPKTLILFSLYGKKKALYIKKDGDENPSKARQIKARE